MVPSGFQDQMDGTPTNLSVTDPLQLSPSDSQSSPIHLGIHPPSNHTPTPPLLSHEHLMVTSLSDSLTHITNGHIDSNIPSPTLPTSTDSYKLTVSQHQHFKQEVI